MTRAGSRLVTTKTSSGSEDGKSRGMYRALAAGQVDRSIRPMDEHRPAGRADQPGDGHPTAVGPEAISALAAPHPVGRAPAVELRAALAQPQHRPVSQVERERAGLRIHPEPLHEPAVLRLDPDRQGSARDGHPRVAAGDHAGARPANVRRRIGEPQSSRTSDPSAGIGCGPPTLDRHHADPDDGRADGGHADFDRPAGDHQPLVLGRPDPG